MRARGSHGKTNWELCVRVSQTGDNGVLDEGSGREAGEGRKECRDL